MPANALEDLVASLRADGSVESEGQFTLDREQARSKMQKFQLADARRYVLELVQAAVLRGEHGWQSGRKHESSGGAARRREAKPRGP
jgi:hypothetical protein